MYIQCFLQIILLNDSEEEKMKEDVRKKTDLRPYIYDFQFWLMHFH